MTLRIEQTYNTLGLEEIGEKWISSANGSEFGVQVTFDACREDLNDWLLHMSGVILRAIDTDQQGLEHTVGFFAVFSTRSSLSTDSVALEKYWYADPQHPGIGKRLLEEAFEWSRRHRCSHLIVSASNLASDMHDKVCRFYEILGMKKFETAYIAKVE